MTTTTNNLILRKIVLEFGAAPEGSTLPAAVRNADNQPRVLVSKHAAGTLMLFRHDVPAVTRGRLSELGGERAFTDEQAVTGILAADSPVQNIWRVRWYTCFEAPDASLYPDVVMHDGRHAIMIGDEVAARAWTVAGDDTASEVEVETHPSFRQRGFASQVVASWLATELGAGKAVFYSHLTDNAASEGVSRRLGLVPLSDEVEYL